MVQMFSPAQRMFIPLSPFVSTDAFFLFFGYLFLSILPLLSSLSSPCLQPFYSCSLLDQESVTVSQTRPTVVFQKALPKAIVYVSLLFTFTSPCFLPDSILSLGTLSFPSFLLSSLLPPSGPLWCCSRLRPGFWSSPLLLTHCPPLCSPPLPCPPNPSWAHYDLARLPLSKPELSELITRLATLVPPMLPVKGCPFAFLPGRD